MRPLSFFIVLFFITVRSQAGNDPAPNTNKSSAVLITKHRLIRIIDSVLDLKTISKRDVDLIIYYSSILKTNKADTVKLQGLNLRSLRSYSEKDEHALFPCTELAALPSSTNIIIENGHLSFFSAPFAGVVTSNFGVRDGKMHTGIDIDLQRGDQVRSAFDGKVRIAKPQGGYGNVVIIMHPNGLETVYAHLSKLKVKAGDVVRSGDIIGLGGNTGHSTGSHLHFEIRYKGHPLNPALIVSFQTNKLYYHTISLKTIDHKVVVYPANCLLHNVSKGDSWPTIADRYGLSIQELMVLNGTAKRYYLKAGQQIRIN